MIATALANVASAHPERTAIVFQEETRSYQAVHNAFRRIRERTQAFADKRVGVQIANIPQWLATVAALDDLRSSTFIFPASMPSDSVRSVCEWNRIDRLVTNGAEQILHSSASETESPHDDTLGDCVVLLTSGTSGPPKLAMHSWKSLAAAVSYEQRYLNRRWLLTYDVSRFAGLQVVLQCLLTEGTLVVAPERDPEAVWRCIIENAVEFASATPTFWRMLLLAAPPGIEGRTCLVQVTLGGEPASQNLLDRLRAVFPEARVSHIYASTEMGACFSVSDRQAGIPLDMFHDDPNPDCSLRIASDGELLIRSKRAMTGYVDGTDSDSDWFHTGDMLSVEGDRALFVGRRHETINVGGAKVYPSKVEDEIRSVDGVREVIVRGAPSSLVGQIVLADVQPREGVDVTHLRERILTTCRARLQRYEVPAIVEFQAELPMTDAGKLSRRSE